MGMANLIPGVSGGTMVLAMGLYTEFIDSVADVTALRFSRRRLLFLLVIGVCAVGTIGGLAGVILYLLFHHATAMYALFIGMTLGGAPLLAKSLRPMRGDAAVSVMLGFGVMVGVFMMKETGAMPHNTAMDFASGVVGSTTMVLPGISGSYMLLVLDQYDRIVGTIEELKDALKDRDRQKLKRVLWIVVPVGIGVVLGIVALSNVLKFLLHRFERPTIGFLLGMLLGSVIGLWPFGRVPSDDALVRRDMSELVTFAARHEIPLVDAGDKDAIVTQILTGWSVRGVDDYAADTIVVAVLMVMVGFAVTFTLARRGASLGAAKA